MYSKGFVLEATYTAAHNLYVFFEFFFNLWVYLNRKFVDFRHGNATSDDFEYVYKNIQRINKLPQHLTLLLGNEAPSHKDLANLVIWSIASGIPFITFYDHKGILKKAEMTFQEAVNKRKSEDDHIIWSSGENSYKNGFTGKRKIHVKILTTMDGRQRVTDVARQFCEAAKENVDQEMVENNLKDNFVFPDPDLGLYCGKVFSVYGYPPWQIRTTEFLCIDSHHGLTPYTFVASLYRYSKTEQRLGK